MKAKIIGLLMAGLVWCAPIAAHAQLEEYNIHFLQLDKPGTYGQIVVDVSGVLNPAPIRVIFSSNEENIDHGSHCEVEDHQVSCPVQLHSYDYVWEAAVVDRLDPDGTTICVHQDFENTQFSYQCYTFENTGTPFPYPTTATATITPTVTLTSTVIPTGTPEPTVESTATVTSTEVATAEPTEEWENDPVETPDVTPTVVVTWTMAPPIELTEEPTVEVTPEPGPGSGPVVPTGTPTPVSTQAPTEEPTEEATAQPTEEPTTELPVEGTPIVVTVQPPTAGETTKQPGFRLSIPQLGR